MIKYFHFKRRKDCNSTDISLREKHSVHDKPKETYISKRGALMIYGVEASGKTYKLQTIVNHSDEIWKRYSKIIFKSTDSLSEILHKNLDNDEETQKLLISRPNSIECIGEEDEAVLDISKQYIKFEALIQKAKKSVLIIDDIDKLTGKKLELTKDLLRECKLFICSAKSEDSIHRTLRAIIKRRKIKISEVQLTSTTSQDATNVLFAMFIVGLFVGGLPEAAMLVMAGRFATKGMK
jgi:chromosomal replication initiation ATPase DnaA